MSSPAMEHQVARFGRDLELNSKSLVSPDSVRIWHRHLAQTLYCSARLKRQDFFSLKRNQTLFIGLAKNLRLPVL